ncbi:MAG: sigma-70 family RNA polymerase sigma factor [Muribaculaceae bacterium]|nr:sigma-70 family RNA polymerase sigma factor [Muribaculaceae bacterium]
MTNKNDIEKLFKAHYQQMYRMAKALLHDDDSARDIVHDVFESLLYSKNGTKVSPSYLLSSVRNRALNMIRDKGIHDRILNLYFCEIDEYDTEDWPDDKTITEIYHIIKEELSPSFRRVMELRFIEGLKFSSVAETLGLSENAVYRQVRQALVIIRKNLNQNG